MAMMKQSNSMLSLTLNAGNRVQVLAELARGRAVVACLCAAWCDTCASYRAVFEALAQRHPDQCFLWIDIEDQSETVGELDIDNFPTVLIQRDDLVAFFGPLLPDPGILQRLLQAQLAPSAAELAALVAASSERRTARMARNLQSAHAAAATRWRRLGLGVQADETGDRSVDMATFWSAIDIGTGSSKTGLAASVTAKKT